MKILTFLCILMILIVIGCYVSNLKLIKEGFLSGTDVQLLTSKPYYTWYDYLSNLRRYPYNRGYPYGRRYPYGFPYNSSYGSPYNYRYNYRYNYPYYRPTYF